MEFLLSLEPPALSRKGLPFVPALSRSDTLISLGLSDEWLKQTPNGKADLLRSSLVLVDLQIHLTFRNYYNGMISAQDNYYVPLVWVVSLRVGR